MMSTDKGIPEGSIKICLRGGGCYGGGSGNHSAGIRRSEGVGGGGVRRGYGVRPLRLDRHPSLFSDGSLSIVAVWMSMCITVRQAGLSQ